MPCFPESKMSPPPPPHSPIQHEEKYPLSWIQEQGRVTDSQGSEPQPLLPFPPAPLLMPCSASDLLPAPCHHPSFCLCTPPPPNHCHLPSVTTLAVAPTPAAQDTEHIVAHPGSRSCSGGSSGLSSDSSLRWGSGQSCHYHIHCYLAGQGPEPPYFKTSPLECVCV